MELRHLAKLIVAALLSAGLCREPQTLWAQNPEPIVLRGHLSDVLMAQFVPHGDQAVTASADETARLWDVKTGRELRQYLGHTGPVYCLAVSADGRTLVTGAQDNSVRVWDIPLAKPILRVAGHDTSASGISLSPDGRFLVSTGGDRAVRFWETVRLQTQGAAMAPAAEVPDRTAAVVRAGHATDVVASAYRADGLMFATADTAGEIRLWSPFLDAPMGIVGNHSGGVTAIGFHPNNQQVFTAGADGTLRAWQLASTPVKELTAGSPIRDLLMVPNQMQAITAADDQTIRLWDLTTGQAVREFPKSPTALTSLAMIPNGGLLAAADETGRVRLMNFADGADRGSVAGHDGPVRDLAMLADNLRMMTAGQDGTVRLWQLPTAAAPVAGHTMPIRALNSAASGQWFVTGSDDKSVRVWNPMGQAVRNFAGHTQAVTVAAVKRDDQQLASGDAGGVVQLWNATDGAAMGQVYGHAGAVTSVDYDRSQPALWTGGADGTIKRWQLPLVPPRPSPGHTQEIRSVAATADGRWCLSGSMDQSVRVWDLMNGQMVRSLAEAAALGPIQVVAISADGMTAAAAGDAGVVQLWNLADGAARSKRTLGSGPILDLAFFADGKRFATVSQDQVLRIWSIAEATKELANDGAPYVTTATSADRKRFAVAGQSNGKPAVFVRDRDQGKLLATVVGHEAAITAVALNATGTRLITGSADKSVRVWNLEGGVTELKKQEGFAGPILAVAISDDGSVAYTAAGENSVRQWKVADGMEIRQLQGHTGVIRQVYLRATTVASAADDGTLRLWDAASGAATRTINHGGMLRAVDASLDGSRLLTMGTDRIVKLWNAADGASLLAMPAAAADLTTASLSGDGQRIAVAAADGIRIFQADGKLLEKLDSPLPVPGGIVWTESAKGMLVCRADGRLDLQSIAVEQALAAADAGTQHVAVSPDGKWILTAGVMPAIRCWPVADGRVVPPATIRVLTAAQGPITDLSFSPDGLHFAASSEDKTVAVWETAAFAAAAGDLPPRWKLAHEAAVRSLALASSEPKLTTCSDDGFVTIWDLRSGKLAERMSQNQPQRAMAIAGKTLVTGGKDTILRTWTPAMSLMLVADPSAEAVVQIAAGAGDVALVGISASGKSVMRWKADGTPLPPLAGATTPVRSLASNADGTKLLGVTAAGEGLLWTVADGMHRGTLKLGVNISSVAFSKDGSELLVSDQQPRVRIFSLDPFRLSEEIPFAAAVERAVFTGAEARQVAVAGAAQGSVATRALIKILPVGDVPVTSLAVAADGARCFAGTAKGRVVAWKLADLQPERAWDAHADAVSELAIAANGQAVISGGRDKQIKVWNTADGMLLRELSQAAAVSSLQLSGDGLRAASTGDDGSIQVWEVASGLPLQSVAGHMPGPSTVVRWHADGMTLVSAARDQKVRVSKTSIARSWRPHLKPMYGFGLLNAGAVAVSSSEDGRVVLTDLSNGQTVRVLAEGLREPRALAIRPDGLRIAVGAADGEVKVWNAANNELLQTLMVGKPIQSLAWSSDGLKLAAGTAVAASSPPATNPPATNPAGTGASASLVVYGAPATPQPPQPGNELIKHQEVNAESPFVRVAFEGLGRNLWSAHADGRLSYWACATPSFLRRFDHGGPVYAVAISRDGSTIVSGSADQTVRLWDMATGQQRAQLTGHQGAVHAVAFTPDESMVVSAAADRTIRLWDVTGGRQLKQLANFEETIYTVAVHPNGQTVAAAGADRKVHLLNIATGVTEKILEGHTDYVHSLLFDTKGTRLMSFGYAGNLKVWNLADGKPLYAERIGRIGNTAQYSADGASVILASGDGTAKVIALPPTAR